MGTPKHCAVPIKTHFAFHYLAPVRTWTAEYKARMEGALTVIQQEQVEEASSRTTAKQPICTILERWEASLTSTQPPSAIFIV